MTTRCSRLFAAALALLLLSGCVGKLLGGGKPAQLYRLGAAPDGPGAIVSSAATAKTILLMPIRADSAIDGDRMLASRGAETSYIAGARWIAPLSDQLEQTLRIAVRRRSPSTVLLDRRDGLSALQAVQVTIGRFEAHFPTSGDIPEIVLEGEAQLIDLRTRAPVSRLDISARRQARSGDIAAIVAAFDETAADALGRTADWITR